MIPLDFIYSSRRKSFRKDKHTRQRGRERERERERERRKQIGKQDLVNLCDCDVYFAMT